MSPRSEGMSVAVAEERRTWPPQAAAQMPGSEMDVCSDVALLDDLRGAGVDTHADA